jgi:hypothetical protein
MLGTPQGILFVMDVRTVVIFCQHFVSSGHLNFKIPHAGSFYNLTEIAEYYYSIRTADMRGRGVYTLRVDGKC